MGLKDKIFSTPSRKSDKRRSSPTKVTPLSIATVASEDSSDSGAPLAPLVIIEGGHAAVVTPIAPVPAREIFLPTQEPDEYQEQRPVRITPCSYSAPSLMVSTSGSFASEQTSHTLVAGNVTTDKSSLALGSLVCLSVLRETGRHEATATSTTDHWKKLLTPRPERMVQECLARNMKFYLQQQPRKELKQQRSRPRDSVIDKAHREARECLLKADTAGAIRVYEALLQRQPEKVDAQRSDTLSKLAVLSLIDGSTNRNRKAVKYSSEALNLHRNNARPLHAAVAAMEVGLVHFGSNMPGKALTMWRQAMQMACMAMGYDHPHVAVLLNNIGVLHYESGDWVGSLRALEESVELQKTMLRTATVNVDHALHQLATTMGNLAMTYERRGDSLDQSISLLQETLALYESMETSNDTMEIVSDNLERLLSDDGHADSECAPYETKPELEARDLLVVLPKEQQLLRAKALFSESDNVPDCRKAKPLEASDNHDFLLLGPLDPVLTPEEQVHATALVWFGKSVEPCNETVGHYIASFASSCATEVNLKEVHLQALDHLERGEFDHALDLFRAALRALREKHGDNHHLAGSTLHNIGMIHLLAKQYIQAHSCFVEAVKVRSAALGPDHRDVAASKMKIGLVQLSVGNLEKARKAFREIRESFLRVLGFHHPQFAKIMNNLGVVLYHYRDYAGAVRAFELAYEYQRQHREDGLGGSTIADFGVANSLCNIGFVHAKHGDPVNAVQLFEQALEIRQNHFKDNDPRILQLKSNMIRLGCTRDKSVVWANGDRQSSCVAWADASDETSVCHTTRSMCMADLFGAAFEP